VVTVALIATAGGTLTASATPPPSPLQQAINAQIAKYGGVQTSSTQVTYENGHVIMTFMGWSQTASAAQADVAAAAPAAPAANYLYPYGCPTGNTQKWFCFYENSYFNDYGTINGRMLEFADCNSTGYWQSLANYGFAAQTSSWVNDKTDTTVNAYGSAGNLLWTEGKASSSATLNQWADNAAYSFRAYC
jgi:hypothetical protein